jgi:hypothetical protein
LQPKLPIFMGKHQVLEITWILEEG